MQNDNFRENIKTNLESNNCLSKTDKLLSALGLYPLPNNVEITISPDNSYLNIKLKDTANSVDNHLLFQLPLKDRDLSALQSRTDYQELLDRYHTYTNEYIDEIKEYALKERAFLQERFPNLVFTIKIRIKSYESYINKLNKNIQVEKSPYINDIMAERIILTSIGDSQDEKDLIEEASS